jgi:Predicted signal transduction protein
MLLTQSPMMTRLSVEQVVAGISVLPSSPRVLLQLHALLRSNYPTLQEVSSLVRLDAGLTALVLQVANGWSAERGEHCVSVEEAVNRLGFNTVHAMVERVSESQLVSYPLSLYGMDMEDFWRASVACALASERLAEIAGEDKDAAYMAGLLHAAGMVAIDRAVSPNEPSLVLAPRVFPREFTDAERALLGLTNAEVGAELLKSWGLPATVVEPIRWQLTPLGSAGYARAASLLYAAKWLRAVVCLDEDREAPAVPPAVLLRPLRITPEQLARLVVDVRMSLGDARNTLEFVAA